MVKKAYAVNSGSSYSDYGVDALFSTKAKAEEFMRAFPKQGYCGYNDIDEYELDPLDPLLRKGVWPYKVILGRDGDIKECRRLDTLSYPTEPQVSKRWTDGRGTVHEPQMWMTVHAKSDKHAIKIANDARAQLIALNKWPE